MGVSLIFIQPVIETIWTYLLFAAIFIPLIFITTAFTRGFFKGFTNFFNLPIAPNKPESLTQNQEISEKIRSLFSDEDSYKSYQKTAHNILFSSDIYVVIPVFIIMILYFIYDITFSNFALWNQSYSSPFVMMAVLSKDIFYILFYPWVASSFIFITKILFSIDKINLYKEKMKVYKYITYLEAILKNYKQNKSAALINPQDVIKGHMGYKNFHSILQLNGQFLYRNCLYLMIFGVLVTLYLIGSDIINWGSMSPQDIVLTILLILFVLAIFFIPQKVLHVILKYSKSEIISLLKEVESMYNTQYINLLLDQELKEIPMEKYAGVVDREKKEIRGDLKEIDRIIDDIDAINTWTFDYSFIAKIISVGLAPIVVYILEWVLSTYIL